MPISSTQLASGRGPQKPNSPHCNVRVIVRCRPLPQRDLSPTSSSGSAASSGLAVIPKPETKEIQVTHKHNRTYTYDAVCDANLSQKAFFQSHVVSVVDEVLKGFNCTIFAYGQTGTGKTYTMEGDEYIYLKMKGIKDTAKEKENQNITEKVVNSSILAKIEGSNPNTAQCSNSSFLNLSSSSLSRCLRDQRTDKGSPKCDELPTELQEALDTSAGIIPRAVHHIFEELDNSLADYSIRVSYLEIYNEELHDLLHEGSPLKLKIHDFGEWRKKGLAVDMLEEAHVKNPEDIFSILSHAVKRRKMAATKVNDRSSRSHTIFAITIHIKERRGDGEDVIKVGKLNLVDLAGSENIQRSGVDHIKDRKKESGMINQSLLTLGRVINALIERSPYVPYRDSKLTRLLQESLGGRAKTCIVATISPSPHCLEETLSTLDYAFRAKNIRNKPEINQKMSNRDMLRELNREIERLKLELLASREKVGVYIPYDRFIELESRIDASSVDITKLNTSIKEKEKEIECLATLRDQLKTEIEVEKQEKAAKEAKINILSTSIANLQNSFENSQMHVKKQTLLIDNLKNHNNVIRSESQCIANNLSSSIKDLHEQHTSTELLLKRQTTNITDIQKFSNEMKFQFDDIRSNSAHLQSIAAKETQQYTTTATNLITKRDDAELCLKNNLDQIQLLENQKSADANTTFCNAQRAWCSDWFTDTQKSSKEFEQTLDDGFTAIKSEISASQLEADELSAKELADASSNFTSIKKSISLLQNSSKIQDQRLVEFKACDEQRQNLMDAQFKSVEQLQKNLHNFNSRNSEKLQKKGAETIQKMESLLKEFVVFSQNAVHDEVTEISNEIGNISHSLEHLKKISSNSISQYINSNEQILSDLNTSTKQIGSVTAQIYDSHKTAYNHLTSASSKMCTLLMNFVNATLKDADGMFQKQKNLSAKLNYECERYENELKVKSLENSRTLREFCDSLILKVRDHLSAVTPCVDEQRRCLQNVSGGASILIEHLTKSMSWTEESFSNLAKMICKTPKAPPNVKEKWHGFDAAHCLKSIKENYTGKLDADESNADLKYSSSQKQEQVCSPTAVIKKEDRLNLAGLVKTEQNLPSVLHQATRTLECASHENEKDSIDTEFDVAISEKEVEEQATEPMSENQNMPENIMSPLSPVQNSDSSNLNDSLKRLRDSPDKMQNYAIEPNKSIISDWNLSDSMGFKRFKTCHKALPLCE